MARIRPEGRLDDLVESAARVFTARGFRLAQMADVAREMGVSPGTLYHYVEGKEALFDLVVRRAFLDDPPPPPALPVPTPEPGHMIEHVRQRMAQRMRTPELVRALKREQVDDVRAELEMLLHEHYDLIARNHRGMNLLERSAVDRPELAALYFGRGRSGLIDRWRRYLTLRAEAGLLRSLPDPAIAARVVIETTAWFAMHRFGDPAPQIMDDGLARETVVTMLLHALIPEEES